MEWLAFNAFVRRLGGGAVCPLCRERASSEAEIGHPLEGRSTVLERGGDAFARSRVPGGALERGGDCSVGLRGVRMGHMLGFFGSFSFFQIWKEAGDLRGPSCLNMCLCFRKWS